MLPATDQRVPASTSGKANAAIEEERANVSGHVPIGPSIFPPGAPSSSGNGMSNAPLKRTPPRSH